MKTPSGLLAASRKLHDTVPSQAFAHAGLRWYFRLLGEQIGPQNALDLTEVKLIAFSIRLSGYKLTPPLKVGSSDATMTPPVIFHRHL